MYDYKCTKCGTIFEELVFSSTETDNKIKCPKCDFSNVKRQLSAPFISANSGFEPTCETPDYNTPAVFS